MLLGTLARATPGNKKYDKKSVRRNTAASSSSNNDSNADEVWEDVALVRHYEKKVGGRWPGQELLKTQNWTIVPINAIVGEFLPRARWFEWLFADQYISGHRKG
jgi:hypothetical protein